MTRTRRWLRFNAVGAGGFVLQLATLAALLRWTALTPSAAVAVAVLAAVSHNFLWHERVTWPDLPRQGRLRRWATFHASTGAVSLATNVGVTTPIAALTGLPIVAANLVAILVASVANFLVSDRVVFRRPAAGGRHTSPRTIARAIG